MYLGYTSGCNSNEVGTTEKFRPGWQNSEISTAPAERQDTNVEHGRNDAIGLGLRSREYLSIYMCVQPLERLKQSLQDTPWTQEGLDQDKNIAIHYVEGKSIEIKTTNTYVSKVSH